MASIPVRAFGNTSLTVSALGFGAGHIGDASLPDQACDALLGTAVDLGITLIDTARSYGTSEARIGRFIKSRRRQLILSTKVGYGIPGIPDWTGPCITAGIDEALRTLQTDVIDIVHLHSCGLDVLTRGDVIQALLDARRDGKIRVAAYSGDNDAAVWAAQHGSFGGVQTSINVFDQRVLDRALTVAFSRGLGVIAKRPLGNAPWRFTERPTGHYAETYWHRWRRMGFGNFGMPFEDLALRFAAFQPGVHACIVGTASVEHLRRNAAALASGPLPPEVDDALKRSFRAHDDGWVGQV